MTVIVTINNAYALVFLRLQIKKFNKLSLVYLLFVKNETRKIKNMFMKNPGTRGKIIVPNGHNADVTPPAIKPASAPCFVMFLPYSAVMTRGPNELPRPDQA